MLDSGVSQPTNPFEVGRQLGHQPIVDSSVVLADRSSSVTMADEPANPFDKRSLQDDRVDHTLTAPLATDLFPSTNPSQRDTRMLVLVYTLIMVVIMVLAISLDRKRFGHILQSLVNSNNIKMLYRDKPWTNGQEIILYLGFLFNVSFAGWLYMVKSQQSVVIHLFFIILAVTLIYMIRHLIMWILSRVYPVGLELSWQNYSIALHNMSLGFVILPMILALEFFVDIGYQKIGIAILAIIVIIYLLRQIKGLFLVFNMRGLNPLYFFIYLCALEISPFLVGYKWLSGAL